MTKFNRCFKRETDGWVCTEATIWQGPPRIEIALGTHIKSGTRLNNVDLAKLLEQFEQFQKRDGSDASR
jgi:hypothetical protein